jgi:hypothetical protein
MWLFTSMMFFLSLYQESTEEYHGKSLSCGTNYFYDFNRIYYLLDVGLCSLLPIAIVLDSKTRRKRYKKSAKFGI